MVTEVAVGFYNDESLGYKMCNSISDLLTCTLISADKCRFFFILFQTFFEILNHYSMREEKLLKYNKQLNCTFNYNNDPKT